MSINKLVKYFLKKKKNSKIATKEKNYLIHRQALTFLVLRKKSLNFINVNLVNRLETVMEHPPSTPKYLGCQWHM